MVQPEGGDRLMWQWDVWDFFHHGCGKFVSVKPWGWLHETSICAWDRKSHLLFWKATTMHHAFIMIPKHHYNAKHHPLHRSNALSDLDTWWEIQVWFVVGSGVLSLFVLLESQLQQWQLLYALHWMLQMNESFNDICFLFIMGTGSVWMTTWWKTRLSWIVSMN